MKRGKKYNEVKKLSPANSIDLNAAVKEIKHLSTTKFNGKVEAHISLQLTEKDKKQALRGSVVYKSPIGKAKRVLVFADPKGQDSAKEAGADYYGLEDLIAQIKDGWADFDVAIATPSVMAKIAVLGKALGTKGLMPNVKSGTVTENITDAVKSYKGGKVDYRSDANGVIHTIIGTTKTSDEELESNMMLLLGSVVKNSGKSFGNAIKTIYICPTMGPSIQIKLDDALKEA